MNIAKLVFAFVARKPLTWAFHVLTLSLGVGVIVSVLLLGQALDRRFSRDLAGVDLVVGAKGSPLQLIMSALFQIDIPTGNIPLSVAERLAAHPLVAASAPISMGDSVSGVRIVGTTQTYGDFYNARLARGRWWREPMEVVLGAQAARSLGLDVGAAFVGQHGLSGGEAHGESPYRVVGVLQPTGAVIDRLALTDTESVWRVHAHHEAEEAAAVRVSVTERDGAHEEHAGEEHVGEENGGHEHEEGEEGDAREVTALLIKYRSTMSALMLPRMTGAMPNIQAAVPALEVARLNVLFGTGADVLRGFGLGLLGLSVLGFFTALFAAVQQRQRQLALLRTLGGSRGLLLSLVSFEALALGLIGGGLGVLFGRGAAMIAASATAASGGPMLDLPPVGVTDLFALTAAALLSLAAALAPGLLAYRLEPAQALRT